MRFHLKSAPERGQNKGIALLWFAHLNGGSKFLLNGSKLVSHVNFIASSRSLTGTSREKSSQS